MLCILFIEWYNKQEVLPKMAMFSLLLICICTVEVILGSATPITPSTYAKVLKQGFSTNYFNTLDFDNVYDKQNVKDVYAKGFRNLRIPCTANLEGLNMTVFLTNLETVVDDCLDVGVTPVISWVYTEMEGNATAANQLDYLQWWTDVATQLKDKDYGLSFSLFADWTESAVKIIRKSGGNNKNRVIMLASPIKDDDYVMVETNTYASGPQNQYEDEKCSGSPPRCWEDDGIKIGKVIVDKNIDDATNNKTTSGLPVYWGSWSAVDNKSGTLNQTEVIDFCKYFVNALKTESIPWSLNSLDLFYDTTKNTWLAGLQTVKDQQFNMSLILDTIVANL